MCLLLLLLGDRAQVTATSGPVSRVGYDGYGLLPTETTDRMVHITTARYDYRLLQAYLVTGPNGNRTAYGFSPLGLLGLLHETALLGKEGHQEGGLIAEVRSAAAQPLRYQPTTWLEYDFFTFKAGSLAEQRVDMHWHVAYAFL